MKNIFLILFSFIVFTTSFGQGVSPRSSPVVTVMDSRWMAQYNMFAPRFSDTSAANVQKGVDSSGAIIFTYTGNKLWIRSSNPHKWIELASSSSSFPTWQQTLINGSILTQDNSVDADMFSLNFLNLSSGSVVAENDYTIHSNSGDINLEANGDGSVGINIDNTKIIGGNFWLKDTATSNIFFGQVGSIDAGFRFKNGHMQFSDGSNVWNNFGTASGTVTSVSSGYGTNFSTITTTGSVIVDSLVMMPKVDSGYLYVTPSGMRAANTLAQVLVNGNSTGNTEIVGGASGLNLSMHNSGGDININADSTSININGVNVGLTTPSSSISLDNFGNASIQANENIINLTDGYFNITTITGGNRIASFNSDSTVIYSSDKFNATATDSINLATGVFNVKDISSGFIIGSLDGTSGNTVFNLYDSTYNAPFFQAISGGVGGIAVVMNNVITSNQGVGYNLNSGSNEYNYADQNGGLMHDLLGDGTTNTITDYAPNGSTGKLWYVTNDSVSYSVFNQARGTTPFNIQGNASIDTVTVNAQTAINGQLYLQGTSGSTLQFQNTTSSPMAPVTIPDGYILINVAGVGDVKLGYYLP